MSSDKENTDYRSVTADSMQTTYGELEKHVSKMNKPNYQKSSTQDPTYRKREFNTASHKPVKVNKHNQPIN